MRPFSHKTLNSKLFTFRDKLNIDIYCTLSALLSVAGCWFAALGTALRKLFAYLAKQGTGIVYLVSRKWTWNVPVLNTEKPA